MNRYQMRLLAFSMLLWTYIGLFLESLGMPVLAFEVSGGSSIRRNHQSPLSSIKDKRSNKATSLGVLKKDVDNYYDLQNAYAEKARLERREIFNHEDWVRHRSSDRYFRNLSTLPQSSIVQNLLDECAIIAMACIFVILYNELFFDGYSDFAEVHHDPPFADSIIGQYLPSIKLPTLPFTLSSTALGLLLVFRTNTSYSRWLEGRQQWSKIMMQCRNILLMGKVWSETSSTDQSPPPVKKDAIKKLGVTTWAFPRTLRKYVSGQWDSDEEYVADIRVTMKDYPQQAEELIKARHPPLRALHDLFQVVEELPISDDRKMQLAGTVTQLVDACGACERLYMTPVPLSYTRHTARFLTIWLLLLPLALYEPFGGSSSWNHISMIPAAAVLTFLFFGIEEIAVSLEEPFSIQPLNFFTDDSRLAANDLEEWSLL